MFMPLCTHPVLSGPALDNIQKSAIGEVVVGHDLSSRRTFDLIKLKQILIAGI